VLRHRLYLGHQPDALGSDVLDADLPPHELLFVPLYLLISVKDRANNGGAGQRMRRRRAKGRASLVAAAAMPNLGEHGSTNS